MRTNATCSSDEEQLASEAAALMDIVRSQRDALNKPGVRDIRRAQLGRVLEQARTALETAPGLAKARFTLLEALALQADDARYGAGQLSRGAQRAPTVANCEAGWARVESIVKTAEEAAQDAVRWARNDDPPNVLGWVRRASADAAEARKIVDSRNHAYTFHAQPGFSFGEGWYLSAATVIDQVPIQVEPNQAHTPRVERFVRDAGLAGYRTEYRPRPRANKPLTDIIARGFRRNPNVQRSIRQAFIGEAPLTPSVVNWVDTRLREVPSGPKVLLWVRYVRHHPHRNTSYPELEELAARAQEAGLRPILVGDALRDEDAVPAGTLDWTLFWKDSVFQQEDMRRAQIHFFEYLRRGHQLLGQIGVTTAGMDGPALIGLPTIYLTDSSNVRMREWQGAVPGYEEVIREGDYLDRVSRSFRRWIAP